MLRASVPCEQFFRLTFMMLRQLESSERIVALATSFQQMSTASMWAIECLFNTLNPGQ